MSGQAFNPNTDSKFDKQLNVSAENSSSANKRIIVGSLPSDNYLYETGNLVGNNNRVQSKLHGIPINRNSSMDKVKLDRQSIETKSATSEGENKNINRNISTRDSVRWKSGDTEDRSTILRDCSEGSSTGDHQTGLIATSFANIINPDVRSDHNGIGITLPSNISAAVDLIEIDDKKPTIDSTSTTPSLAPAVTSITTPSIRSASSSKSIVYQQQNHSAAVSNNPGDSRRVRFKSLLGSAAAHESDEISDVGERELKTTSFSANSSSSSSSGSRSGSVINKTTGKLSPNNNCDSLNTPKNVEDLTDSDHRPLDNRGHSYRDEPDGINELYEDNEDEEEDYFDSEHASNRKHSRIKLGSNGFASGRTRTPSASFKRSPGNQSLNRGLFNRLNIFSSANRAGSDLPYIAYEDKDLLTGTSKYQLHNHRRRNKLSLGRTFRGSYKYSRAEVSMAIFKKLFSLIFQRSTAALFGAFLIHVTLGTVYTLSNINSYLTSYMRKHGSPNATYGASMWISASYAVGQGFSMVLGGYIEKRFSARLACFIGCALHSISIMSTSWSVDHGPLAVLVTYGFIPGFGCGLAYMTPMSNGFGWFPNRKGLVAGVILAGFGIGTFVFNMTQTAFVNPDNLSPPADANGYFTQEVILDKVPHLFIFIGSIYASMQFIGCCLLFKPPAYQPGSTKSLDERPILMESEMSLKKAVKTREFIVLFLVYGITTQGVLFVNSMIKEYGQLFIGNDMYLAWTGSMASIANSVGRLAWGLAIDRYTFTQCFTSITIIFGSLLFIMPFEFILSSKLLYLLCTLGIFGSFSGWMSTYPVHLSRVFGRTNSGMIYGLIFVSQSCGGIVTALGAHYLIDHFNRFVPFFCVVFLEILGLSIYHLFYPK